jgi:D-alanyl-D-alanine dipeptidase
MTRYAPLAAVTACMLSVAYGLAMAEPTEHPPEREDPGLVDILSRVPDARVTMRYASEDNLVGAVVDGYERPRCLLSPAAADALAGVQAELRSFGLSILMFDCYRPQRAVDHFVRWSSDPADHKTRARYYPNEDKAKMFEKGYIDRRSGHSRGSTVDISLVDAEGKELDMGTGWDFMDPSSATEYPALPETARRNRLMLKSLMAAHGFRNYAGEWWHYTLDQEPWPDRYFDVPVR